MTTTTSFRLLQTVTLVYTAMMEGGATAVLGPTLPALMRLFHTDLTTISSILFLFGMMNAGGSIFGLFLMHKIHVNILISVSGSVILVTQCVFPYVSNVYIALVIAAVTATSIGVMFNCRVFRSSELWPRQPFSIHTVIGGFALGSVLASLISEPFLDNKMTENHTYWNSTTLNNSTHDNDNRVGFAYVILGCLNVPLVLVSLFITQRLRKQPEEYYNTVTSSSPRRTGRGHSLFLIFFFLLCMPCGGIFITYGNLLSTYGYGNRLHISEQSMAFVTALFWGTFVTGRFVMAFISGFVKQIWIIGLGYIGLFISTIVLFMYSDVSLTWFASATALFGTFCAPFSAASFSWASERIELTKFVVALGSVGEYSGAMLFPYVGGLLMAKFGAIAFVYVILGIVTYQFVLFCCIYVIAAFVLEKIPYDEMQ